MVYGNRDYSEDSNSPRTAPDTALDCHPAPTGARGGEEVRTTAKTSEPLWLREFSAAKYPQQDAMPCLANINVLDCSEGTTAEERRVGLSFRRTGAGNIVATDLGSELKVKATDWPTALRGLAGNVGAAHFCFDRDPKDNATGFERANAQAGAL